MADDIKTEEKKEEAVEAKPKVEEAPKAKPVAKPAPELKPTPESKEEPKVEVKEDAPKPEPAPKPAAKKKAEPKADEPAPELKPTPKVKEEPKEKPEAKKPKAKPKAEPKTKEEPKVTEPAAEGEPKPEEVPKVKGPKKVVGLPPEKVLLFGKYNLSEVVVHDPGLEKYLNIDPIIVPHTGAKHANKWFGKTKLHIIERLLNNLMRTEEFTGKKTKGYKVVRDAFDIIEKRTKSHPVQVLVDALESSAPREEVTRLRYGGISVPKAVDTSSSRRLDIAFRNICKGAVKTSYKNSKPIEVCLANEIILASKKDMNSFAVSKKEELERVAASAR